MTKIQAFRRDDGSVGVRNHLFVLPAVVCANQVAIDLARDNPKFKFIEHQHGCAQIGADLIQTQRVFSNLSLHPNVYSSLFVGLGCEGIIAKNLYEQTKARSQKPLGFVSIQGAGGTLKAKARAQSWLQSREAEIGALERQEVPWDQIRVGILFDDPLLEETFAPVQVLVDELYDAGARLVLADHAESYVKHMAQVERIEHGGVATEQVSLMQAGSNILETGTGLTAAGAHVLIHIASVPHAFGIPLLPVIRFATSEPVYQAYADDFDGHLFHTQDVSSALEDIRSVLEGQESVAESLGLDDFALYRIGPTV